LVNSLTEMPPRMGTRCIRGSTPLKGDMGFAMEEVLLGYGRRLYHTVVVKREKQPVFAVRHRIYFYLITNVNYLLKFTQLHCESLDLCTYNEGQFQNRPTMIIIISECIQNMS
jgi:hypothetical protein